MDLAALSNLFSATLSPDQNLRVTAELEIRKVQGHEAFVPALVQIIGAPSLDVPTRQAAAIYLKNLFVNGRITSEASLTAAKAALRPNILPLIGSSPSSSITSLLRATLSFLVKATWPAEWPELERDVCNLLTSQGAREVYVGVVTLLEMTRAFRYHKSTHIPPLIARTFPLILPIAQRILSMQPSPEDGELLHCIFKSYWMSIQHQLTTHQQSPESIMPWGHVLIAMASHQIPFTTQPDPEELGRTPYWRAKKWTFRVLNRLFMKYGNPSQLPTILRKEYGVFAQKFVTTFAPQILQRYLSLGELYVRAFESGNWEQGWMTDRCLGLVFEFFEESVKPKATWEILKPNISDLVRRLVFPQLAFTPKKKELWESDPVGYVQASLDNYEDLGWPDQPAAAFLLCLAKNRSKASYQIILSQISDVFSQYPNARGPEDKFGAVAMVMALEHIFLVHPLSHGHVETLVMQYIVPDLQSPHAYLRSAACDAICKFEEFGMNWTNKQQLVGVFEKIMFVLRDPELPVRVSASFVFSTMMSKPEVRHLIAPNIGQIMQGLLQVSDELALDTISGALDNVVENFAPELKTLAVDLVSHLRDSYLQLFEIAEAASKDDNSNADESGVKVQAAISVLRTIGLIIDSQKDSPQLLETLQELVVPIIVHTLDRGNVSSVQLDTATGPQTVTIYFASDFLVDVYNLTDSLLSHLKHISPSMWRVFELTFHVYKSTADYYEDMMPALDSFIEYGSDVLAQRPDYCKMFVEMYTMMAFHEDVAPEDRKNISMVTESFVMALPGRLSQAVSELIVGGIHILTVDGDETVPAAVRTQQLNVLLSVLVCYPLETLIALEQQNSTQWFLKQWLAQVPKLARVHDLQLTIGAVCALWELGMHQLPPSLAQGQWWAQLLSASLAAFGALPLALIQRDEYAQAVHDEEEDDDDDVETIKDEGDDLMEELDDDENDVWDEDSEYMELLAEEAARLEARQAAREAGIPAQTDDDDEEEEEVDLFFETAVDKVNPYIRFKNALLVFQQQNPPGYAVSTTALNQDQQVALMEIGRIAMEKEREVLIS